MSTSVPPKRFWLRFFEDAGIPSSSAQDYAYIFASERLRLDLVADLSRREFEDLGIPTLGDQLVIKKRADKILQERRHASDDDYDSASDGGRGRAHTHSSSKTHQHGRSEAAGGRSRHRPVLRGDYSDDDEEMMDVDHRRSEKLEKPREMPVKSATSAVSHRFRVVRPEDQRSESLVALRMLSTANSTVLPPSPVGKLRSELMEEQAELEARKNRPAEPMNKLSRLAPAEPAIQPVLIRNLKSKSAAKKDGGVLKRLGPRGQQKSAVSRLGKKSPASIRVQQAGNGRAMGFAETAQNNRTGRRRRGAAGKSSALQRLGGRNAKSVAAAASGGQHPLSRY